VDGAQDVIVVLGNVDGLEELRLVFLGHLRFHLFQPFKDGVHASIVGGDEPDQEVGGIIAVNHGRIQTPGQNHALGHQAIQHRLVVFLHHPDKGVGFGRMNLELGQVGDRLHFFHFLSHRSRSQQQGHGQDRQQSSHGKPSFRIGA
jgi:hypothetical protein